MGTKVLVAMSGGVDSSVAAALLKEQGYELIGVTMALACTASSSDRSCCSQAAAVDAKRVADLLGFPHYTINLKAHFQYLVIDNFIEEYKSGRTPNPCVRCNRFMKFDLLHRKAKELGADFVATGHYAIIMTNDQLPINTNEGVPSARYKLLKGKDPKKDQSYVLYMMSQESLARTLFPLGEMTKVEVRAKAKELKLPVAEKKESQEICFVSDDNYHNFLKENVPQAVRSGLIVDKVGREVGRHAGIAFYTIGQRKGIGAHRGEPRYVIKLDPEKNEIIIGDDENLFKDELTAGQVSFVSGEWPAKPLSVQAKIRYNASAAAAILDGGKQAGSRVRVKFKQPQRAITPGQSVVFYDREEVLGGGIISG